MTAITDTEASEITTRCAAATAAFDIYREIDMNRRAAFLERIAENILALGQLLIDTASRESKLPSARLEGERARTVGQLRMFAEVVRQGNWQELRHDPADPDRKPSPRPELRLRKIPLGPVVVFGASNFPLAFSTAGGDTASALAAGCPVIVKGHPGHPETSNLVAGAIQAAASDLGLPSGVFGYIAGASHSVGAALVENPNVAAVGFTGSRKGGLALLRAAQARPVPIPMYAEMSSINPVILLPQALTVRSESLGREYVVSMTLSAGQLCTNPGMVLAVEGPGLDAFLASAGQALDRMLPAPMLNSGISEAYAEGVAALSRHHAVSLLARGGSPLTPEYCQPHLFVTGSAAVMADPTLMAEIFGAASLVVRCENAARLRDVLAAMEGQLTATIHLDDEDFALAGTLLPLLERKVGRIIVNGWPTGVEVGHAQVHGGPYPATSDARTTSVGSLAIDRFLRPVCYQNFPRELLPASIRPTPGVCSHA